MNGDNNRIHVNSTNFFTYYFPHAKRGKEAIDLMGTIPFFTGMLLTDHWSSYKKYENILYHFFCLAHILRELLWSIENEKKDWPVKFKKLILDAKKLKDKTIKKGKNSLNQEILDNIFTEYSEIITNGKTEYEYEFKKLKLEGKNKEPKGFNLLIRLEDHKKGTLGFITYFRIPFDNNLAERDLRPTKTRLKIYGCFRSFEGLEYFCRIRSYISTLRKHDMNIYEALNSLFKGEIILPQFLN